MNRYFEKMFTILAGLCLCGNSGHLAAQRTLNPGEEWNCAFDLTNPWLDLGPSPTAPAGGANGQFSATLNTNLPPGTVLRCEIYEGLFFGSPTDGQPLSTFYYTSAPPNTITGWVAGAWPDQEGIVRFTALNAPATIQLVDLEMDSKITLSQWFYHYLTIVPPVAAPRLSVSFSSDSVQLRWWTNGSAGYVLESANSVTGASWQAVNTQPTLINSQKSVTIKMAGNTNGFFRLKK